MTDLNTKKLKELKELAQKHKITGRSTMNKATLITELSKLIQKETKGGKPKKQQESVSQKPSASSLRKPSASVKKPSQSKSAAQKTLPICDNVRYIPNYIGREIRISVEQVRYIIAKYDDKWWKGTVGEKQSNGKYLIIFSNGSEGEFTETEVKTHESSGMILANYNGTNYTGLIGPRLPNGKYIIMFDEGSEGEFTQDEVNRYKITNSSEGSAIAVVKSASWDDSEKVVKYKLVFKGTNKSAGEVYLNELYEKLDPSLPLTLKTSVPATQFQLWGNRFTPAALREFNSLRPEENERRIYLEWNGINRIRELYLLSEIHKFFKLFENPLGIVDLPDHPGLEQYRMTAENVRGRKGLIGQLGLRIRENFDCIIKKGTILGIYKGTVCTEREARQYEESHPITQKGYQFNLENGCVIDPYIPGSPQPSLLIYANDVSRNIAVYSKTNAVFTQNCAFREVDMYGWIYIVLIALKDLYPGEEIGVDYGNRYIM
jgi:hypothetical protein